MAGRPTKFDKRFVEQARKLAFLGLTDAETANVLGVTRQTLLNWRKSEPKFAEALDGGKIAADANVAASLYERACGYEHAETVLHQFNGRIIKTVVKRRYPPDVRAIAQWLHNRQPGKWRSAPSGADGEEQATPVKVVIEVKSARRRNDADPERTAG